MEKNFPLNTQVLEVSTFEDFISSEFHREKNAICWKREIVGDFSEIIEKIKFSGNMIELDPEDLLELDLSEQGNLAREILLNDYKVLKDHGKDPIINIIKYYERDDSFPFFPTDVYSFHVDRSPIPGATFLCTYYGESSDILPNSQAVQKIIVPEIRAELKKIYTGKESDFEDFLRENFFDLHYQMKPDVKPINLDLGSLWKLAIDHPESKVLPCIHRAPKEKDGEKRLMLIC